jgi:outer membrane protein assembly factor BamB
LDTRTGEERWKIDFPAQFSTPLQPFGAACSPIIVNDFIYVQLGGGLTKISLADGTVQWRVLEGEDSMMSKGAFSSPTVATIAGTKQLVVQTREQLCGVSLENGEVYWKEAIEAFRGMNILTPTIVGDRIFTAAHSGISQLFEITNAGEWKVSEVWNQKTQGYMSSPVVIEKNIYMHMKNERAVCLSLTDGEIQWTGPPASKYWSMIHNGNRILALSADGQLRLINATPAKYEVIDTVKVAEDSWAYLALIEQPDQSPLVVVRALDELAVYRWGK